MRHERTTPAESAPLKILAAVAFLLLEVGAGLLICAAILSVPVASDKRMAIGGALDTILSILAAATIYQLLLHRLRWRRALLAGLVAIAAANT